MPNPLSHVRAALTTRARSARDLCAYVIQHELVFAIGLTAMTLGLLPSLKFDWVEHVGWAVFAAGTVLSLGLFWRDTHELVGRFSGWEFERVRPAFSPTFDVSDPDLPVRVVTPDGSVFTSPDLNRRLTSEVVPVVWREERFRLEGELRTHAASMVRRSTSARRPFNGPCVRLDTGLSTLGVSRGDQIVMREARYFDALCSNLLTGWNISKDGIDWPFRDRYLFAPIVDGQSTARRLQPLGSSALANIVGVSTLAITTDDFLLTVLQSRNSGSSAQRRAPSGSGSLEPRDFRADSETLSDVVINGAVRELSEECGLASEDPHASTLIGYGRWLDHGGKPEFMAVTALSASSTEVAQRPSSAGEAIWTQSVRPVPLNLGALAEPPCDPNEFPGSFTALVMGDEMAAIASVPLEWGVRCLSAALVHDPGLLQRLRAPELRTGNAGVVGQ